MMHLIGLKCRMIMEQQSHCQLLHKQHDEHNSHDSKRGLQLVVQE